MSVLVCVEGEEKKNGVMERSEGEHEGVVCLWLQAVHDARSHTPDNPEGQACKLEI